FAGFVSPLDGRTAPARRPTRRVRNGGARHRRPALRLLRGTALDPDRQLPLRDRSARALPAPAQALVAAPLDGRDGGGVLRFRGFRDATPDLGKRTTGAGRDARLARHARSA